jgi:hypothetical protein
VCPSEDRDTVCGYVWLAHADVTLRCNELRPTCWAKPEKIERGNSSKIKETMSNTNKQQAAHFYYFDCDVFMGVRNKDLITTPYIFIGGRHQHKELKL